MKARKLRPRGVWLPIGHRELGLDEIALEGDLIFCKDGKTWKLCDKVNNPGYHGQTVRRNGGGSFYRFTRKIA